MPRDKLVEPFMQLLRDAGVEVRPTFDSREKWFRATCGARAIVILAHESNRDEWWGIQKKDAEQLKSEALKDEHGLIGWGAALLDKDARRGYWIKGDNLFELERLLAIKPNKKGLYEIKATKIQLHPHLAVFFSSTKKFVAVSELKSE